MARREHAVDAGERIEAREPDFRLAGQALHRVVDVAELEVLRRGTAGPVWSGPRIEKRGSKPRTPLKPLRNRGTRLPGLISQSLVPRLRANLRDAGREPAVLGRERVREHLHRLEALPGQLEIEVTRRRIDEAGAADLQRALRRLAAFRAQPPVRTAHDAGQQRQQALEVVAFERRDIEDRARHHVAGRDRLHALCRRRRRAHLDALRDERQMRCRAAPARSLRRARRTAPNRWARTPGASPG